MTTDEIKQALRETKKICCPLAVIKGIGTGCPMTDGEAGLLYPLEWPLDWPEDKGDTKISGREE